MCQFHRHGGGGAPGGDWRLEAGNRGGGNWNRHLIMSFMLHQSRLAVEGDSHSERLSRLEDVLRISYAPRRLAEKLAPVSRMIYFLPGVAHASPCLTESTAAAKRPYENKLGFGTLRHTECFTASLVSCRSDPSGSDHALQLYHPGESEAFLSHWGCDCG